MPKALEGNCQNPIRFARRPVDLPDWELELQLPSASPYAGAIPEDRLFGFAGARDAKVQYVYLPKDAERRRQECPVAKKTRKIFRWITPEGPLPTPWHIGHKRRNLHGRFSWVTPRRRVFVVSDMYQDIAVILESGMLNLD